MFKMSLDRIILTTAKIVQTLPLVSFFFGFCPGFRHFTQAYKDKLFIKILVTNHLAEILKFGL